MANVKIELKPELAELLRDVLAGREPDLLGVLSEDGSLHLDAEQADRVRETVGDELMNSGFQPDWEPNERGRELETLIDLIGEPFM